VERRHELVGEQRAHHLSDRVGRDHSDNPEPRRELGRQGGLAHARRPTDQNHQRDLERLDLAPALEVPRVSLAGQVLEDAECELAELLVGDRRDAELAQALLDRLGDLVRANGRQPGHHDLRRHQALRVRQARVAIGDQDLRVLGVVRHLYSLR
jgi:hypothetical protein